MKLRQLIRVIHRDVGYFCVGLTVFFCVSGVAVNHIDDWNPSYDITTEDIDVGPLLGTDLNLLQSQLVARLNIDPDDIAGHYRPQAGVFRLFLPNGGEANVATATGRGTLRRVETRTFIFESNVLHLNHIKGVWTYVSDAFAVMLLLLAITGLFILKGRQGLGGRGKWFTAAGVLLPIGFIVYYYVARA